MNKVTRIAIKLLKVKALPYETKLQMASIGWQAKRLKMAMPLHSSSGARLGLARGSSSNKRPRTWSVIATTSALTFGASALLSLYFATSVSLIRHDLGQKGQLPQRVPKTPMPIPQVLKHRPLPLQPEPDKTTDRKSDCSTIEAPNQYVASLQHI
jgi:hypothetical protein